jgi:hypothetical protein
MQPATTGKTVQVMQLILAAAGPVRATTASLSPAVGVTGHAARKSAAATQPADVTPAEAQLQPATVVAQPAMPLPPIAASPAQSAMPAEPDAPGNGSPAADPLPAAVVPPGQNVLPILGQTVMPGTPDPNIRPGAPGEGTSPRRSAGLAAKAAVIANPLARSAERRRSGASRLRSRRRTLVRIAPQHPRHCLAGQSADHRIPPGRCQGRGDHAGKPVDPGTGAIGPGRWQPDHAGRVDRAKRARGSGRTR